MLKEVPSLRYVALPVMSLLVTAYCWLLAICRANNLEASPATNTAYTGHALLANLGQLAASATADRATMLRATSNALIVPPFECAWLSLQDYQLEGAFCLQFDCKGENDVTIILKPVPGAKRWQHLQRQQGVAGGEVFAVEDNYTVILGSHRNSKLKIEKNGDEQASASGLPGCTVNPHHFTTVWINYTPGVITVGTGPVGTSITYQWRDSHQTVPNIRHIGLSCWDKHVSYRNVQLLPPVPAAQLQEKHLLLQEQQTPTDQALQADANQVQQQDSIGKTVNDLSKSCTPFSGLQQQGEHLQRCCSTATPPLLQLVQDSIQQNLTPSPTLFQVLQLSELLLPRTQQLYDAAVQLAGSCFALLVQQHLDDLASLSVDVLADILQEPLLDVPELLIFHAVAAWCQLNGAAVGQPGLVHQCERACIQETAGTVTRAGQRLQQQSPQGPCQGSMDGPAVDQPEPGAAHCQCSQHPQQSVPCSVVAGVEQAVVPAAASSAVQSPANDVLDLLQLVRFGLMSDADRQAVLQHPFAQQCRLVQQCMQDDLQRLRDSNGSTSPEDKQYTFEQRRLVRPTGALGSGPTADSSSGGASMVPLQHRALSLPMPSTTERQPGSVTVRLGRSCQQDDRPVSEGASVPVLCDEAAAAAAATGTNSNSSSSNPRGSARRRYRRRLAPSCKELMYVCDGDKNGVVYYIATDYGTKQWVNPVLSKAVDVKASSPPSRYTDPKALVSGQFLNTSFAGPKYIRPPPAAAATASDTPVSTPSPSLGTSAAGAVTSNGSSAMPSSWWQLDLGPPHRLLCNYYTIRHDGSQDGFVRSWVLQGSIDLHHWLDLKRHISDNTIRLPGQFGSWPVTGPAASMPFRAFRLLLLGPTHSHINPWAFCLSHWELYGYFYKLGGPQQQGQHQDVHQQR